MRVLEDVGRGTISVFAYAGGAAELLADSVRYIAGMRIRWPETLDALAGLKLVRYAVDKDADLRLYGLEPPELVLEVSTRAGKRTLQIGRPDGESKRRYARVAEPGRTDVFVISEADAAKIVRDAAAFTRPPLSPPKPAPVPAAVPGPTP